MRTTYATRAGVPVCIELAERGPAVRKGGVLDATDFHYNVEVGGKKEHVQVLVSGTAFYSLAHHLKLNGPDSAAVVRAIVDLGTARILQGLDKGIDLDKDFAEFPASWLAIRSEEVEEMTAARDVPTAEIRAYIERRLHAAWSLGKGDISDAVAFDRADALYLGCDLNHLHRVIELYSDDLWVRHADGPILTPTRKLLKQLEEGRSLVSREAERLAVPATRPMDRGISKPMYDVALSFAGEDRTYVETVASILKTRGVRVFYDDYEKVDLWGKDLYEHLAAVYSSQARFTVMFISKHYAAKVWTRHERRSAQARALSENREYILPARFDDTEVEGLLPTIGYVDLRRTTPEQLADLIVGKLARLSGDSQA